MKNFALIGTAGYIAPRHLKAIKETGNNLLCAVDPHDSVGILDQYFPNTNFFTEFERFDRHVDKLRRNQSSIDFVSICSPNYLHDAHIRWALRSGADAICEKPMVVNPWNVDILEQFERETGRRIWNILQLRLHAAFIGRQFPVIGRQSIKLIYITPRGSWYHHSWKGDEAKSGGIATNIGIHFFDLLISLFGVVEKSNVLLYQPDKARGELILKNADVEWFLSIDESDLPDKLQDNGQRTFRHLSINNEPIDFSEGFTDLHTQSYREIFAGHGFGITDARPAIELAHSIRQRL
ncbi:MAG: gfo/Idh/MocA family oxidoreductase [Porphyromonadaceae bacterium]|nr:MAG: gfo/Idh/MocA family oxidoreductase [Porphyromonadaceae bacterium]